MNQEKKRNWHLPELTSKTHNTFFTFGKLEVFLGWNNTMLKPKHLKKSWCPFVERQRTAYGHDVSITWLGGYVEISYIK